VANIFIKDGGNNLSPRDFIPNKIGDVGYLIAGEFLLTRYTQNLIMGLISNPNSIFTPSIFPQSVPTQIPFLASTNSFPTFQLIQDQPVSVSFISSSGGLFAMEVIPGQVYIDPVLLSNINALYPASIIPASINVVLGRINNSNSIYSPTLSFPAAYTLKRWTGSAWQSATIKIWDGNQWSLADLKIWSGTNWENVN